jgi:uncharacterized protein YkwD
VSVNFPPASRLPTLLAGVFLALGLGALAPPQAQAQPMAGTGPELMQALTQLRTRGCPGGTPTALRAVPQLDDAARRIADGTAADAALRASGYRAVRTFQVNLGGHASVGAVAQTLGRNYCDALTNPQLTDVGSHRRGGSWWIVLAAPFSPPPSAAAGDVAARVLALTNQARSQPRRCGNERFAAAPPLRPNELLDRAAAEHARQMARHSFMDHQGRDGSEPSDRISRAGYRWRSVGENVAAGQTTAEEVVRDWLRSPGHCANLMSPRFTEMGIAYAVNPASESGMYWTQTFGRPR